MKPQTLLVFTAVPEILTGIGLLLAPALLIRILLGAEINDPVVATIARVGGSAIVALGILCWLAQKDKQSISLRALTLGLLVYNVTVFAVLAYSAFSFRTTPVLIVALIFHAAMAIFSFTSLQKFSRPV
jgi:quinol-cytochrome oxidoreductase complex cytochrome b subunit